VVQHAADGGEDVEGKNQRFCDLEVATRLFKSFDGERFDGAPSALSSAADNAVSLMAQLNEAAESMAASDAACKIAFRRLIRAGSAAADWYATIKDNMYEAPWAEVSDLFLATFAGARTMSVNKHYEHLLKLEQRPKQRWQNYFHLKLKLAKEAGLPEILAMVHVVNGLRPHIKQLVTAAAVTNPSIKSSESDLRCYLDMAEEADLLGSPVHRQISSGQVSRAAPLSSQGRQAVAVAVDVAVTVVVAVGWRHMWRRSACVLVMV
jgi:hypothetical protein